MTSKKMVAVTDYDLKLTIYTDMIARNPPIIRLNVIGSPSITFAVEIAINGTVKIKTLVCTAPNLGPAYMKTDVPKHIAPIETKKKLIRK